MQKMHIHVLIGDVVAIALLAVVVIQRFGIGHAELSVCTARYG
jgi:hypothetical protein